MKIGKDMIIPEVEGVPGDFAVYTKKNGLCRCTLRCFQKNRWYIETMNGDWEISNDGNKILGGILTSTNAIRKENEIDIAR